MLKELLPTIRNWTEQRKPFTITRVIETWGSSPRPTGSTLLVSNDGEMSGSVSGGCVEGAVLKASKNSSDGHRGKLLHYGVSDTEAWAVGLTCGGQIDLLLQDFPYDTPAAMIWKQLFDCFEQNIPCALVTSLTGDLQRNTLVVSADTVSGESIPAEVLAAALTTLGRKNNDIVTLGEERFFIQVFPRRDLLLIIGAAHITADLVQLASLFGFETTVVDPRGAFADKTHFPVPPDRILESYPSEVLSQIPLNSGTFAVILSHDPKIDDDALRLLLRTDVAYIGALGSRKSHEKRVLRLKEAGFTESEIQQIEAPIGMPISAQGAREIALSIMGSVIRTRNGR